MGNKRSNSIGLYKRAKKLIPGGTQLLSKRPEMYVPNEWPSYYAKCKGINVWDMDGNEYIDMTISGVGACPLGYGDNDVDSAVLDAIQKGNMCTLNVPEEVTLAEVLLELHPWAQMVRYARTGGEALSIAVRIARCATKKDKVLFCGYHGWHDWYLSANLSDDGALDGHLLPGLEPCGVPRSLRGSTIPFSYNNINSFKEILHQYQSEIAAVVMEPIRNYLPAENFLEEIREITSKKHIVLIFDEVTSGFRMNTGGIHMKLRIEPDIAVFAKGISNGYPMAAIIGKEDIMKAAHKTFISSTYWTDRIGPSAAIATIKKYLKEDVPSHLVKIGKMIQNGWKSLSEKYNIVIKVTGIPPLSHWEIQNKNSQLFHTIINFKMLERGILTSKSFYATYAHKEEHVERYLGCLDEILSEILPYLETDRLEEIYKGPVAHTGFKRLT